MEMSRINDNNDDLTSLDSDSLHHNGTSTRTGSLSSGYEMTPCNTPPRDKHSPRMVRRSLQLTDDSTWSVVTRNAQRSKGSGFKFNFNSSASKFHSAVFKNDGPEFRFRATVGILLITIIVLIVSTNYLYKRERILIAIRDRILFLKSERKLNLLNNNGHDLLSASLALNIPKDIPPVTCHTSYNDDICLDWKYRAQLVINYDHNREDDIRCYNIKWKGYDKSSPLRDCFDLRGAYWYGMGEVHNKSYPLNQLSLNCTPFVTGHKLSSQLPIGSVISRYWVSSKGVSIVVPLNVPLYVSFNENHNDQMCFESRINDFPYYSNTDTGMTPFLSYKICTGPEMINLHNNMIKSEFNDLNHQNKSEKFLQFFDRIIWATDKSVLPNFTQQSLQSYIDRIMNYGFDPGFILLDSRWESHIGDFAMDSNSFANPLNLFNIFHNKGFKILMTVTPYVEINATILESAITETRLVINEDLNVPLLTRCGESFEKVCGLIDIKKSTNREWFKNRLKNEITKKLGIDGFVFINGQTSLSPRHDHSTNHSINPDNFLLFYKEVARESSSIIGFSSAVGMEYFEGFVNILPRESSWTMLRTIIPTVMTLGLIGFPLVNPGTVGGNSNEMEFNRELYLRWLELSIFLPIIQFAEPPGGNDLDIIKVTKVLLKVREERILPELKKGLVEYLNTGAPIIRPLWYLQSDAKDAYTIDNQFAIGNDIIVAPILEPNKTERDVYLPLGWWKDEIHAQVIRGGKWMRKYHIPIDKIAYFIRTEQSSS